MKVALPTIFEDSGPEHISIKLSFALQDRPINTDDCCLTHLASFRPDAIREDAELKSGLLDVTYYAIAESTSRPI